MIANRAQTVIYMPIEGSYGMKKDICISLLVVICLIFLAVPVMAQEGRIHVGSLKIIPGITIQGGHDDNIYLDNGKDESETSDWLTHIMPSLFFDYGFRERLFLKIGYEGDMAYYSKNGSNDWQGHKGEFGLNYEGPGGLIIDINNAYVNTEDPYGSLNEYNLGIQTERWNNDLKTRIGFEFSDRFQVLAYFNYHKQDYDRDVDDTQDYDVYEIGAGFQMKVLPKTWGFVRYHNGERDYFSSSDDDTDSDFDWHRVNAGLTWGSGARFSGELNFGYQWKDYENSTDVSDNSYRDKNTWIASTLVSYEAGASTELDLGVTRALRESGSDDNEYSEDTGIGIGLRQGIAEKLTLVAGASYSENEYNVLDRDDDNYKFNAGLDYRIQPWLLAGVAYNYWRKNSNVREYDFTDNRFMVTVSAEY